VLFRLPTGSFRGAGSGLPEPYALLPAILAALLLNGISLAQRIIWQDPNRRCMRLVAVKPPAEGRPGEEAVHVTFPTGGFLLPDGGDIRVLTGKVGNDAVPYKVIHVGPGDRVSLLFKYVRGENWYRVFYGSSRRERPHDWTPQRGLILETRQYRKGNVNNWAEMQKTIEAAGPMYGRGLVEKVWHGHNPLGPSQNVVSIYKGWLRAEAPGQYEFATTSAAASFLFVDDKLVVSWPGWHWVVRDARHRGRVNLNAGVHKFAYYHAQGRGTPIMVAAWRLPGKKKFEIIPPEAFLPPLEGKLVAYRMRASDFAPDFDWRNESEAAVGERWLITMKFTDTSFPRTGRSTRREWDFGDGVTSKEQQPLHTYLAPGTYEVSLKIHRAGRVPTCKQKVIVNRDWARQPTLKPESLEEVAERIAGYPWERMTAPALLGAIMLYRELKQPDEIVRLGDIIIEKFDDLSEADRVQAAVTLGTTWRDEKHNPENALRIFQGSEKRVAQKAHKARLAVLTGDTFFHHLDRPAAARTTYERVLKEYPEATKYVRLATMRLGDLARSEGKPEEARYFYRKSLEYRPKKPAGKWALEIAMRALETEDLLRQGQLDEVEKSLDRWQWEEPEEKLRGQWSELRIRLAIKLKNWEEAAKEAETLLRVNPESQYAPAILLLLARVRHEVKDQAGAREALERLKEGYPDSPLVAEAEEMLAQIGRQQKGR